MFERGDFVWAKLNSYPWWPAMVLSAKDCRRNESQMNKLWVFWFGDHKFSEVDVQKLRNFETFYSENVKKSSAVLFNKAIEEILQILASAYKLKFQDTPALLKWANSGFQSDIPLSFKWKKLGLPTLIETTILKNKKLSSNKKYSDSDSEDEIADVLKGKKSLEDICIGCCKKNVKLIAPHPLFLGKVCIDCKKSVNKVCKMPSGQIQDLCILCGLGGNLVYCSNNVCFRSFCQVCIECLVSEKEYIEILEKENWLCYLCEMNKNKNCLIRRRTTFLANAQYCPPIPKSKASISVLALNETGLRVLEKTKIKVKNYFINPQSAPMETCMEYSQRYKDFSLDEIIEIAADLIMGSFFPVSEPDDRRKCVTAFFQKFYRFLYRLDTTRINKQDVVFIFLAKANILDGNVLSRVARFLMVSPVFVNCGENRILVWSNLPNSLPTKSNVFSRIPTDDATVEETILSFFMKHLKKCFEV